MPTLSSLRRRVLTAALLWCAPELDRAALERAAPGVAAWFESPAFSDTMKK